MKTFIKDVSKTVIRASIILLVMYAQRDIMVDVAKILVLIIVHNAQRTRKFGDQCTCDLD